MKLYHISQSVNNDYDTYSDAVVSAKSIKDAKTIHPDGNKIVSKCCEIFSTWAPIDDISVEYLGKTKRSRGVICASFHAG